MLAASSHLVELRHGISTQLDILWRISSWFPVAAAPWRNTKVSALFSVHSYPHTQTQSHCHDNACAKLGCHTCQVMLILLFGFVTVCVTHDSHTCQIHTVLHHNLAVSWTNRLAKINSNSSGGSTTSSSSSSMSTNSNSVFPLVIFSVEQHFLCSNRKDTSHWKTKRCATGSSGWHGVPTRTWYTSLSGPTEAPQPRFFS